MKKFSNISLSDFRAALKAMGLEMKRQKGGHEAWWKAGMTRTAIIQTHVDPVPERIVLNVLRDIGVSKEDFRKILENL